MILKKIFGELKITWLHIIGFAIMISTLQIMLEQKFIPINSYLLKNNNIIFDYLRNIFRQAEIRVLFILIIVTNCIKPLESALKTFFFFFIFKLLEDIYYMRFRFSFFIKPDPMKGWYFRQYFIDWFVFSLILLPIGYICWYIKKKNIFSIIILHIIDMLLIFVGMIAIKNRDCLMTPIICLIEIISFTFSILENKKVIITSLILNTAISFIVYYAFDLYIRRYC